MLDLEVFISELFSVDRFSSSAVVVGEVSSLGHEVSDHSVESRFSESESFLSSAESSEVGCSFGDDAVVEFEDDLALWLASDLNIKEDFAHFNLFQRLFKSYQMLNLYSFKL